MRRNDMRGYQNKDTFGAIFKNTRKRNDKEPDYRGSFQWHGEELDIGGWVKTDRAGNTYLSIRVSEKWVPNQNKREQLPTKQQSDDDFLGKMQDEKVEWKDEVKIDDSVVF